MIAPRLGSLYDLGYNIHVDVLEPGEPWDFVGPIQDQGPKLEGAKLQTNWLLILALVAGFYIMVQK